MYWLERYSMTVVKKTSSNKVAQAKNMEKRALTKGEKMVEYLSGKGNLGMRTDDILAVTRGRKK